MVLPNLEDYTFWANSLSENPNSFDFSTLLHDGTQWKLDAVDQHNAVKSDASGNSMSQSGTSRTESQDPNADSFTGTVSCTEISTFVTHASPGLIPCFLCSLPKDKHTILLRHGFQPRLSIRENPIVRACNTLRLTMMLWAISLH
jgi:hypothetical protein